MPSMPIPSATTHKCSPKCTPSIINATRSSPDRSMASSSASAVSVAATNRRETADLLVAVAGPFDRHPPPTGSRPVGYRRADSPASIRPIAIRPSTSVLLNSS